MQEFDSLKESQKEAAEIFVKNAIERKQDTKIPKLSQREVGEMVGVTDRTVRYWLQNPVFLDYMAYLSTIELRKSMPDFVGVLIHNLQRGQNVSTKQMELFAKISNLFPENNSTSTTNVNIELGHSALEDRIKQLQDRKEVFDVPPKQIEREEHD